VICRRHAIALVSSALLLPCLALAFVAAVPALAQVSGSPPAVSELNGKLSLEAGSLGDGGRSSAIGIARGSIAAPLGHSFGVQADGAAATAFSSFGGGGAAHLFWRDPQVGLFGPIAALAGARGTTAGWYGAEGEIYAPVFTIGANGGYQDTGASTSLRSGGFYRGYLTVYPVADLALTIGGGQLAGRALGTGKIEFQPDFIARHSVSFFVNGAVGDNSSYRVTSGVRLYFGPEKTLIRRHREDDPRDFWDGINPTLFCGGHGLCPP
jgi:hypothetical protein